jgi:hypothetical protein
MCPKASIIATCSGTPLMVAIETAGLLARTGFMGRG